MRFCSIVILFCFLFACNEGRFEESEQPGFGLIIKKGPVSLHQNTDFTEEILRQLDSGAGVFLREYDKKSPILSSPEYPWIAVLTADSVFAYLQLDTNKISYANGIIHQPEELVRLHIINRLGIEQYDYYQDIRRVLPASIGDSIWTQRMLARIKISRELPNQLRAGNESWEPGSPWWKALKYDFPSLYIQRVDRNEVVFYQDFRYWLQLAKEKNSVVAKDYVKLWIRLFPQDSIEHRYRAYQIAESEGNVYSLLGSYVHYECLSAANTMWQNRPSQRAVIEDYKNEILTDILGASPGYWYDVNRIGTELDSLLAQNWSMFSPADRVALEARRAHFGAAADHGIAVDFRSGL